MKKRIGREDEEWRRGGREEWKSGGKKREGQDQEEDRKK